MFGEEDWLQDPLRKRVRGSYKRRKLKNTDDDKQNDSWWSFHFATRLKLDGTDYFCRQALGAASMPDKQGLPLLAHRQIEWYLGAFFFELVSAYDTLLQELNIVYAYDSSLKPHDVRWDIIKPSLPEKLVERMEEEWEKDWFHEVRSHRNLATHHYVIPLGSFSTTIGDEPVNYREHTVSIYCIDKMGTTKAKDINVCTHYLEQMVVYINQVWQEMAQKFQ